VFLTLKNNLVTNFFCFVLFVLFCLSYLFLEKGRIVFKQHKAVHVFKLLIIECRVDVKKNQGRLHLLS